MNKCARETVSKSELVVLDPGHFHAALVQKEMYLEVSRRVSVYAPLGGDVLDYLTRITAFNTRLHHPTEWEVELHASPDFLERMLEERPGNVVVLAGRNRPKIERIAASVRAGFHALADKPWIITSEDLPKLGTVLDEAGKRGLVAYDIMTERYEITSILQRELVNDAEVFGSLLPGSETEPAITARSVHNLMKTVAGMPIRRPAWFFDIREYGEGLADVGTHVVDLVQWTAFPEDELDYRADVHMLKAKRWPTVLSRPQFQQVTGEPDFPRSVAADVKDGDLHYFCNNSVDYTVRGVHVSLKILWDWETPQGAGDSYEATFRGSNSRIEIRQGNEQNYVPELYVVPNSASIENEVLGKLSERVNTLNTAYPGLALATRTGEAKLLIPELYRVGHEAHFAQVTRKFFKYLKAPLSMPSWEASNMLVKYFITTKGVELAR